MFDLHAVNMRAVEQKLFRKLRNANFEIKPIGSFGDLFGIFSFGNDHGSINLQINGSNAVSINTLFAHDGFVMESRIAVRPLRAHGRPERRHQLTKENLDATFNNSDSTKDDDILGIGL